MVQQIHNKSSKTVVLDFSGINGAYILPYEFRAKEIDECQEQQLIAEPSLANEEQQDDKARDLEQ